MMINVNQSGSTGHVIKLNSPEKIPRKRSSHPRPNLLQQWSYQRCFAAKNAKNVELKWSDIKIRNVPVLGKCSLQPSCVGCWAVRLCWWNRRDWCRTCQRRLKRNEKFSESQLATANSSLTSKFFFSGVQDALLILLDGTETGQNLDELTEIHSAVFNSEQQNIIMYINRSE